MLTQSEENYELHAVIFFAQEKISLLETKTSDLSSENEQVKREHEKSLAFSQLLSDESAKLKEKIRTLEGKFKNSLMEFKKIINPLPRP